MPRGSTYATRAAPIPSLPHIDMTVAMLRERGVEVDDTRPNRWVVAPGPIAAVDVTIEPDLSNAAPFLAAAAITGGTVTVPHWPSRTNQPGDAIRDVLQRFGRRVALQNGNLTVQGTYHIHGVDLDLRHASELTPVVAAVAALADLPPTCAASAISAVTKPTGWRRWKPSSTGSVRMSTRPTTAWSSIRDCSAGRCGGPTPTTGWRRPVRCSASTYPTSNWTTSAAPRRRCPSSSDLWTKMHHRLRQTPDAGD